MIKIAEYLIEAGRIFKEFGVRETNKKKFEIQNPDISRRDYVQLKKIKIKNIIEKKIPKPEISFRDYVQKNKKMSRPETMCRKI